MDLEAGVIIGDFEIARRLGAGGMGIVYLARQVSLNRLVALKVLGPALNSDAGKARFQREAQAFARLNHPGIAQVYFVGQDQRTCFMAMEYIDGVSLRAVIERLSATSDPNLTLDSALKAEATEDAGAEVIRFDQPTVTYTPDPMPDGSGVGNKGPSQAARRLMASRDFIRRGCEIVRGAALALAHAHERGVIHRDIKPENVLLDRQGRVHIIDLGIARFFEDLTLTNTGALVGTPMYMSPEQVSGRIAVDHRTDVYSLGLTLYELLTLQRPIQAPTREGVLRQIATKALSPASRRNGKVPRALEAVIHKATSKDPDERYEGAAELASDIQRFLDGKPVTAPPYSYRFDRHELLLTRPRGVVLAGSILLIAALIFLEIGMYFLFGVIDDLRRLEQGFSRFLWLYLTLPLVSSAFSIGFLFAGLGSINGMRRARLAATVFTPIALFFLTLFTRVYLQRQNSLFYVLPIGMGYLAAVFLLLGALWQLFRRASREWFLLAARLRSEHRQHASSR